jgi:hypothetical protein
MRSTDTQMEPSATSKHLLTGRYRARRVLLTVAGAAVALLESAR